MSSTDLIKKTIQSYRSQVLSGFESTSRLELRIKNKIQNLVVCGMGGSSLGARVVRSFTSEVSIDIVNDYFLPKYVNRRHLVIISSYSGETEETLALYKQAVKRETNVFVITTNGKLKQFTQKDNVAGYIINPEHNPSKQPRFASGYFIGSMLGLLSNLGFIDISQSQLSEALNIDIDRIKERGAEVSKIFRKRAVFFVSSQHLKGACYTFKNMLNESSKSFSAHFEIPELNHHLMEGLKHPEDLKKHSLFFFVHSQLYDDRIKTRYPITKEVVEKNNYKTFLYQTSGDKKLSDVFEVIYLAFFVQIFLGEYYGEDLMKVPWVDYFKKRHTPGV